MPRGPRKRSEAGFYHVYVRGVGRQRIFEDDDDCRFFLGVLGRLLAECGGSLHAWALMGNHFHLLLRMPMDVLSGLMRNLQTSYALHFNKRHDHSGHLFQGGFGSQPIESDEQLLACMRYIHLNPVKAGLSVTCDYQWSSYRGYLRGAAVTDTGFVLGLFDGDIDRFVDFHQREDDGRFRFIDVGECSIPPNRLTDDQADGVARALFGESWRYDIPAMGRRERDARLKRLKAEGLTARQIERLTGIGRNIINRA